MQLTVSSLVSRGREPSIPSEWKRLEARVWAIINDSKEITDDHILFAIYRGRDSVQRLLNVANDRKESLSSILNRPLQEMKMFGKPYSDGRNPALHFAVLSGQPQIVSMLCRAGAKVSDAMLMFWMMVGAGPGREDKKNDLSLSKVWENYHEIIKVLKEQCASAIENLPEQDKEKIENLEFAASAAAVITKACEKLDLIPTSLSRKRKRPLREVGVLEAIMSLFGSD